jgi:predicted phosphohydrolase
VKTFAWVTDPHLDFLRPDPLRAFAARLGALAVDGLFLTGDIANAPRLLSTLAFLDAATPYPLYFVLGNHDYYGGSIRDVRASLAGWSGPGCYWMPASGLIALSDTVALIGHGGWGDGRVGDFMASRIMLNDYVRIEELSGCSQAARFERLKALGDEAADYLGVQLEVALDRFEEVLLITHVPPFGAACWHEGRAEVNEWTPHFTCGAVGERLAAIMAARPDRRLRVFCGHTHSAGVVDIAPNLRVTTGAAVYRAPALQAPVRCR